MKKICVLVVGLATYQFSWAQPSQPPVAPGQQGGLDTGDLDYTLRPGDQLEIRIFTLPELEKSYKIRSDGSFYHPFAGNIQATGKSLGEIEATLKKRFAKELRNPEFRIGMVSRGEAEASIMGEVTKQGKLKFVPGISILDLVADAGGLTEKADPDNVVLLRGGQQIPLVLTSSNQLQTARMKVQNGDILYIGKGKRVGVSGEVQTKGVYSISSRSKAPVSDAVKLAGGLNETAALNRIMVIRPSEANPILVNLLDPVQVAQFQLEEGDMVVVSPRKAVVLGAVTKQGAIPIPVTATLMDVVSQAGATAAARLDEVVVVRAQAVGASNTEAASNESQIPKEVYNLEKAMTEGSPGPNVAIRDGDMVFIGTKDQSGGLLGGNNLLNLLVMARSLFAI